MASLMTGRMTTMTMPIIVNEVWLLWYMRQVLNCRPDNLVRRLNCAPFFTILYIRASIIKVFSNKLVQRLNCAPNWWSALYLLCTCNFTTIYSITLRCRKTAINFIGSEYQLNTSGPKNLCAMSQNLWKTS